MPVAKSYRTCDILGEPFLMNGRKYVTIETPFGARKNVRWYSDSEYERMYPAEKVKPNFRETLGFKEAGYITIYYGNTYENLSWFKAEPECRYHAIFGWYTPSDEEISNEIPDGVKIAKLYWDNVKDQETTLNEDKATEVVEGLRYGDVNPGNYVGEIGERYSFELKIEKALSLNGYYGPSTMHIMSDLDGNTFVWTTAAKTLTVGETYYLKGTIKDHKEYRGVKQTVLTRCKIIDD